MTMHAIGQARDRYESAVGLTDFVKFAALVMTSGPGEAQAKAVQLFGADRAARLFKSAAPGATAGGAGEFSRLASAFQSRVAAIGAFDRIFADAFQLPLEPDRVLINSSAIIADEVGEGSAKPLTALDLTGLVFTPVKVSAQIVLSRELIDRLSDEGVRVLGRELRTSVAIGSDSALMTALAASSSVEAQSNSTASFAEMLAELLELAHAVDIGPGSKPYYVTTSRIAKALSAAATGAGVMTVGVQGGEILGIPLLVSDGATAQTITLLDATAIAMAASEIELRSSTKAAIEMNTAPSHNSTTPTGAQLVSMFQTNNRCLLAERRIGVKVIRDRAVVKLTGVTWGAGSDSPV